MIPNPQIANLLHHLDISRLQAHLFYLSKDPLPFRKVNFTLPGHHQHTLDETDTFIENCLLAAGYPVEKEACQAQAFRCDRHKPLHHWYSPPMPEDPWYTVHNLSARKTGQKYPHETVVVVSHKDSPSWYESPGAYDNAVGTITNLEIARLLQEVKLERSVWFLFCNEEHWPWTSVTAAQGAWQRKENIVAVFNLDSLGGKDQAAIDAGLKTNVTRYCTPDGKPLAEIMAEVNQAYKIGLQQTAFEWDRTGDDDGSFINAGFPAAVVNLGSFPYADPNYHMEGDIPENVDIENVAMTAQASLAAILHTAGLVLK
jgi:hypothetical protein